MTNSRTISSLLEWISNDIISNIPSHALRNLFYKKIVGLRIGKDSTISMHCKFSTFSNILIKNNTAINQEVYLDGRGKLIIGRNVNVGRSVCVYTAEHDLSSPDFKYIEKSVEIGDNVWIASNVVIIPGVKIGEGAVIAAGAVVTKNVKAYTVVGGSPAKYIKNRPKEIRYKTKWAALFY